MLFHSLLASLALAATVSASSKRPADFVYTDGENFAVNGQKFYFFGTNAYWFSFLDNITDVSIAMDNAKAAGIKVVRTWGFRDLNTTYVPGGLPQYGDEGAGASTIYYQSWTDGKPTINYGPNGLQRLDKVVQLAEKKGLKLILALTNNWADYGGSDVYVVNMGGKYHDDFYRDPRMKSAYKKYVKAVVSRYKDSPAIAMNTITSWVKEMSNYIKSLDKRHMVAAGTEGFFNGTSDDWAYNGADGIDSEALLRLPDIDFGTFHLYPDWWSKSVEWATNFTIAHAKLQHKVKKPVVSEEYGWLLDENRQAWLGRSSNITRVEAIGAWQKAGLDHKLAGDMYWQFGTDGLSFGNSTDDGFTIYLKSPEAKQLIYEHAKKMNRPAW
ncbi:related to beta-mannanase [Serendipita indica DSM 11827]|uniref:mannan endo-1,4-beta-mannosidase n=1 Tax=Serendipita indica (strain DSM 11827) TaxID=1109443 RepID=G4TRJ9_SERID|nr:related to beta-mannanase [Serendipita indica DSM 11827]